MKSTQSTVLNRFARRGVAIAFVPHEQAPVATPLRLFFIYCGYEFIYKYSRDQKRFK
jgi:hypothetical protein